MAHNSAYSRQPSTATRSYATYSFQIKPVSSVKSNIQPTPGPAEPFRETNRFPESGPTHSQGTASIPPMDMAINVLRLEKSKHADALTALHSSRNSTLHLENLLLQERAVNHILRQKAHQAEMDRIFLEGQLRAYQQQNVVCNLTLRQKHPANIYQEPITPLSDYKSAASSPSANTSLPSITEITSLIPVKKDKSQLMPAAKRQKILTISSSGDARSEED